MRRKRIIKNISVGVSMLLLCVAVIFGIIFSANRDIDSANAQNEYSLAENVSDGVTLDCFNWSYTTIRENLESIAMAGYSSIQVCPIQNTLKVDNDLSWQDAYSKTRSATGFKIDNNSWLGSKAEFESLCKTAESFGIKVICDIIANSLAPSDSSMSQLHKEVNTHENKIYKNKEDYIRNYMSGGDDGLSTMLGCCNGLDLITSNSYVQGRVISLLKECIDCGVSGFKFSDAKNIETEKDGIYASSFWSKVIEAAESYASKKDISLYCYGETINGCGTGRDYSGYTKYMSVTDTVTSKAIRESISSGNANQIAGEYLSGVEGKKLVLWAEGSKEYASGETADETVSTINKSWAIVSSRADAMGLYLARSGFATLGNSGTSYWKNDEVSIANKFHNKFIGANEKLSVQGEIVINERYTELGHSNGGAVVVNTAGASSSINISVQALGDGSYEDRLSGNIFVVKDGKLIGKTGSSGIAFLFSTTESASLPRNTISKEGGIFTSAAISLTLGLEDASSGTYKIGASGSTVTYSGNTTITIGNNMAFNDSISLYLTATDGVNTVYKTYSFKKVDSNSPSVIYFNNSLTNWSTVYCYISTDGELFSADDLGEQMLYDTDLGLYYMNLPRENLPCRVTFNNGSGSSIRQIPGAGVQGFEMVAGSMIFENGAWQEYVVGGVRTVNGVSTSIEAPVSLDSGSIAIYFANSYLWDEVYCVYTEEDGETVRKISLECVETNTFGQKIYCAKIPMYSNCFFTDGLRRTVDILSPTNGMGYYPSSNGTTVCGVGSFDYVVYDVTLSSGYLIYLDTSTLADFDKNTMQVSFAMDSNNVSPMSYLVSFDGENEYYCFINGATSSFKTATFVITDKATTSQIYSYTAILRVGKNLFTPNQDFSGGEWSYIEKVEGTFTDGDSNSEKLTYDMSRVTFNDYTTTYDGNEKSIYITGALPDGVTATYEDNVKINAGSYFATVNFTSDSPNYNPIPQMTAILTIEKAVINVDNVSLIDKSVKWTGQSHTITCEGVPNGVNVAYEHFDSANESVVDCIEVGTYTVYASFSVSDTHNYSVTSTRIFNQLVITKADYDMSTVDFVGKTVTYTGNSHSVAVVGELPSDTIDVTYNGNGVTNAGTHTVTASFSNPDAAHYNNIDDMTAVITINKADYNVGGAFIEDKTVAWTGAEQTIEYQGSLPVGVTANYSYKLNGESVESCISLGEYTVEVTFTHSNPNYNDINTKLTKTLTIVKATYDMSGVQFQDATYRMTGEARSIFISGTLPQGVTVAYVGNGVVNTGSHIVTAQFTHNNENYEDIPDMTATLTITTQVSVDMSGISFSSASFVYDGDEKSIYLTGNLPTGVSVTYEGNEKTNAGTYTVTAIFTKPSSHYADIPNMTATLVINKATYDMSTVTFNDYTTTYDGNEKSIYITGALPSGVTVNRYENNVQTNAGTYTAWVYFNYDSTNYNAVPRMSATLKILKQAYTLEGITFTNKVTTYTGLSQSISISGTLPQWIDVEYENNSKVNAGTYTARAIFTHSNVNYEQLPNMTATLTINKATYNMSGIEFKGLTTTYNGSQHKILISGDLPSGVTVSYSNNAHTNAGEYTAWANFDGDTSNYNTISSMFATLKINKANYDMSGVNLYSETFTFTGRVQTLEITGVLPSEDISVSYTYKNSQGNVVTECINPGTYLVTAHFTSADANYNTISSLTASLTIGKMTIYFAKATSSSWTNVYCYYWKIGDTSLTTWPGERMMYVGLNDLGESIYKITVDEGVSVIFSGGSGTTQTVNIEDAADGNCYYVSGISGGKYMVGFYDYEDGTHSGGGGAADTVYVYFTDVNHWGRVWCHYWFTGSAPVYAFPGKEMSYQGKNNYNEEIFRIAIPVGANVVINNGGNGAQTVNVENIETNIGYYPISSNSSGENYIWTVGSYDPSSIVYVTP